ncbi:hypothetical protein CC78DRAFT_537746 [Lojkania enalia]|uniref:Peptidase C14 caspase domain-containing protein n=1 Tax=Lojkania enalia TaxID=147567 RepID=A0A9P4K2V5_9PLEO|nr:hypothetical protein CC78DRAFT_537746 [Didymosphaeria enalia]
MPTRRALLIASSYGGLQGPPNDANMMKSTLEPFGFMITKCCDANATRDGILQALKRLAAEISIDDSVVVYYSGHGGIVESPLLEGQVTEGTNTTSPWRYQFLVPVDYHMSTPTDFRGILDIELSMILRSMTETIKNVTVILDCCHASRMVREPGLGDLAVSRSVPAVRWHDITKLASVLESSEYRPKGIYDEENSPFVCLAAAAATETAWEYRNSGGRWCGAMTEALARVLSDCRGHLISWRASLFRISELIKITFPNQRPYLTGKVDRHHFSLSESLTDGFHILNEVDAAVIQAGSISGVLAGNTYSIMNHGARTANTREQLAEAHVMEATSFRAVVHLKFSQPGITRLPDGGAIAFLKESVLPKWPVEIPPGIPWLEALVLGSRFIKLQESKDSGFTFATFHLQSNVIALHTKHGVEVTTTPVDGSQEGRLNLQRAVEQLARAQHLQGLKNDIEEEYLHHKTLIEFGILENSFSRRMIRDDGTDSLVENSYTFIRLTNGGSETVYITIFNINAVGKISRVSRIYGVELPQGRSEVILKRKNPPTGIQITWPNGVSRANPLEETLLFILTASAVDLCHLATPVQHPPPHRLGFSGLEKLTWCIASGCSRNANAVDDESILRYSTHRIVFNIMPDST